MTQPQDLYAWAAGYDVPFISLTKVTSVTASGDNQPFAAPTCRGYFDPGNPKKRTNSITFFSGYNLTGWYWAAMSWNQYAYIYNTILSGAYSGPITIYTRLGFDAYSRMDAVLDLPPQATVDGKFYAPRKILCPLTRLRTAA